MRIRRVLLVCSGNTCRSPMAAALLRHAWAKAGAGWDLEVSSAGTSTVAGLTATEHAITALSKRGLDLSGHRSRIVSESLKDVDLVLTMTETHKQRILFLRPDLADRTYTLGEYAGSTGDVADPFGGSLAEYERTADALEQLLQAVVQRIIREGKSKQ